MSLTRPVLGFLSRLLFQDWGLKIVCFLLATLYWLYIDGQLSDQREISLPLSLLKIKLPDEHYLENPGASVDLKIQVRGPRYRLQFLEARNIEIDTARISGQLKAGELAPRVKLDPSFFSVAQHAFERMDVVDVQPPELVLALVRESGRLLPVQIAFSGRVKEGYEVKEREAQPQSVTIYSRQDLAGLQFVETEPILVDGRDSDLERKVKVAQEFSVGEGLERKLYRIRCDEEVTARLRIQRLEIEQTLDNVPIRILTPPGTALFVDPPQVSVKLKGPGAQVAELIAGQLLELYVKWPKEWEVKGPLQEELRWQTVQVEMIPRPGITCSAPGGGPLTVRVRGKRVAP